MFTKLETGLPGLVVLQPRVFRDQRGEFVKTFHAGLFRQLGLEFEPREEFFSTSAHGVLRGMHFQLPPDAIAKLVYCIKGRLLDVVLDMRRSSPTFGVSFSRELSAVNRELIFVPVGFAHGFLALEDDTTMVYLTSKEFSPACDAGVRWESFGFNWPVAQPVLSERDRKFPAWPEFVSPF